MKVPPRAVGCGPGPLVQRWWGKASTRCCLSSIATVLGVFPLEIALGLIVANYIFKVAIEIGFTPITYAAVGGLKRAENEDYYDQNTNFNPFHFSSSA